MLLHTYFSFYSILIISFSTFRAAVLMIVAAAQRRCTENITPNMDETIKPEDIASVLKQFDRQKESEQYSTASSNAREVVSSIGTDTPLTVLLDIRHIMTELCTEIRKRNERDDEMSQLMFKFVRQQKESDDQRHREMLAFMNKLSKSGVHVPTPLPPSVSAQMKSLSISDSNDKYYYKGDEIKTSQAIIGCFLLHLDLIVSRNLPVSNDTSDTVVMELKDWSSAVTILREAESNNTPSTGILTLPKKTSEEAIQTLDVIASPISGRSVVCKTEHIQSLILNCPTISNCVEEIRQRALLCPGIISSSRLRNLSALDFPYVTREGVLNIVNTAPKPRGSNILHEKIKQMNAHQKKIYAQLVLANGHKSIIAATTALECKTDFKKWKDSR